MHTTWLRFGCALVLLLLPQQGLCWSRTRVLSSESDVSRTHYSSRSPLHHSTHAAQSTDLTKTAGVPEGCDRHLVATKSGTCVLCYVTLVSECVWLRQRRYETLNNVCTQHFYHRQVYPLITQGLAFLHKYFHYTASHNMQDGLCPFILRHLRDPVKCQRYP
jgi:hypothetical protein